MPTVQLTDADGAIGLSDEVQDGRVSGCEVRKDAVSVCQLTCAARKDEGRKGRRCDLSHDPLAPFLPHLHTG